MFSNVGLTYYLYLNKIDFLISFHSAENDFNKTFLLLHHVVILSPKFIDLINTCILLTWMINSSIYEQFSSPLFLSNQMFMSLFLQKKIEK